MALLPDWEKHDERHCDEEQARMKGAAKRGRKVAKQRKPKAPKSPRTKLALAARFETPKTNSGSGGP